MAKEKPLGNIKSEIVGIQYYDRDVKRGEKIFLEREPDNENDPNAIAVENIDFKKFCFLPIRLASWMAPLIDQGKVQMEGFVKVPILIMIIPFQLN